MTDNQAKMTDNKNNMLTVADVAARTKHQPATVIAWIKKGKLPYYAFDKEYRIEPKDFAEFLAKRRGAGAHQ